ncbi:electron transport complex subunit RsxC [Sulfuricystis multivorans]|uniref:electron transport complex subunit RsxC n=1 Tax=Sulfuricystis multivorans TaxID=2211108 RepID=UPI000F84DB22|nr:electron transport complex subunit RsxC [Sulfuricystis multivorans]
MLELFRFPGGIKPDAHKEESARTPIAPAPLPPLLVVPFRQSATGGVDIRVKVGERVLKGQCIGSAEGPFGTCVHAPTSGTVIGIESRTLPHPSALAAPCAIIEADGEDAWRERVPLEPFSTDPAKLRTRIREAGIVGLGGAVFPSHVKMNAHIETLVINGAECEPWITCDDRLMRERAPTIVAGAAIIRHLMGAKRILFGIEDNKPDAAAAMRAAVEAAGGKDMQVIPVPTRYPAGGEKQMIRVLTGIEIPYGKLGPDFGVQCFNVGTAHAVARAVLHDEPLICRIVTLAGNYARPGNVEARIGTPIDALLALGEPKPDTDRIVMGGPMMGFVLPESSLPVVKATNCLLAMSPALFPPPPPEMPCIRCGACTRACPMILQPHELYWYARSKNFGKAQEYHLFDCIECGCCAYVCPSHIPLVDYYRFAKSEIRAREREKAAADRARERYEFRKFREEREKAEKAARLAAKAAETKAKLAQEGAAAVIAAAQSRAHPEGKDEA